MKNGNPNWETIGLLTGLSLFMIASIGHGQLRGRTAPAARGVVAAPSLGVKTPGVGLDLDLKLDLVPRGISIVEPVAEIELDAALAAPASVFSPAAASPKATIRAQRRNARSLGRYRRSMGEIREGLDARRSGPEAFGSGRALLRLMTGRRDVSVPALSANRMAKRDPYAALKAAVAAKAPFVESYRTQFRKSVVGQEELRDSLLLALLAGGHVLLEGLPGVAKTRSALTLAKMTDLDFSRIQFTRDLQPFDIMGQMERDTADGGRWVVREGPVFANLVLADEINRAKGQTQSALLQAMEEGIVTIEGVTQPLPQPFMVLATQNPIEDEGVYPLPRAQLDRFMLKVDVPYANVAEIAAIVRMVVAEDELAAEQAMTRGELIETKKLVREIVLTNEVINYIARLVAATRPEMNFSPLVKDSVRAGVSDRTAVLLARVAQAQAFIEGRHFVTPEDVKAVAHRVLVHRVILNFAAETEMSGADIITALLDGKDGVPVTTKR